MFAFIQKKMIKTSVMLGLLTVLSGCSSFSWFADNDFKNPEVQLTKVELVKARALEQEFLFRYRIDNPNDVSLSVRGLVYRVHLEGIELANGESGYSMEVPPNSFVYYEIPVHTNLWRQLKQMKQLVRLLKKDDKPIRYQLDGELKSGLVFGRRVPIANNGELNKPKKKQTTMLD